MGAGMLTLASKGISHPWVGHGGFLLGKEVRSPPREIYKQSLEAVREAAEVEWGVGLVTSVSQGPLPDWLSPWLLGRQLGTRAQPRGALVMWVHPNRMERPAAHSSTSCLEIRILANSQKD